MRNIGKKRTGDEVVFFNLVKNLAVVDRGNKYFLFTDATDKALLGKIKKSLEIENRDNFEIISLPTRNRFVWNFWTLPKYLRKSSVDIYLTQYITPFFVPKNVKIATIIHDISFKVYPQHIGKLDLFFLNLLIPVSLRRADEIIGVSKFTRDEVIKYYKVNPDKVSYIHNAVSDNFSATVTEEDKKRVRAKYHLPEKFILYLGTLQPRKNLPTLIEAYVTSGVKSWEEKLVIAGGKGHNYDTRIDAMIKKYDSEREIIFTGYVDEADKAALVSAASVFCFPSFYEGFGIPVLEAMSSGVPVIASKIPPHQEITGGATLLFNPYDSKELAEKISRILQNNEIRDDLIGKGKIQVKKFSWIITAEKVKKIFESMQTRKTK